MTEKKRKRASYNLFFFLLLYALNQNAPFGETKFWENKGLPPEKNEQKIRGKNVIFGMSQILKKKDRK